MCGLCEDGHYCPRHANTRHDPLYFLSEDAGYMEKEAREADMGRPDFLKPWERSA